MLGADDCDVHLPDGGSVRAVAVVLHPHPAMGGDRHHPLVVAVADGLAAAGVAAARVDLRDPDPAGAARSLEAVVAEVSTDVAGSGGSGSGSGAALPVLLVGYSWGAVVSAWASPPGLVARVLVAPPVGAMALAPDDGRPLLALVPAHDQYGSPDDVAAALAGRPEATVEVVEGCDHFLAGAVSRIAERAVTWSTERL